jgi:hypothetical protein
MAKTFFPNIIKANLATVNVQTATADVYVDVPSTALALTEGSWQVVFEGTVTLFNGSGATSNVFGNMAITDNSNNLLDNALAFVGANVPAGQGSIVFVRLTAEVTVNAGQTLNVKARARCNQSSTMFVQLIGTGISYTISLSDPDTGLRFYARRVA